VTVIMYASESISVTFCGNDAHLWCRVILQLMSNFGPHPALEFVMWSTLRTVIHIKRTAKRKPLTSVLLFHVYFCNQVLIYSTA
jgi:hypothetical protein